MPALAPSREECPDKLGLTEDIRRAIRQVIALNDRQLRAVIEGDFAILPTIQSELVEARTKNDSLLDSYYNHVREHGC